ncbi:MAG TPA: M14 family metallopeptidase [Candidatus Sulfopaludibacter sp.]|jgi:murein tripeptide amidase MpaA|nr:M14 family metallopeptidase [Candidatus Sulfopaludibacter sp.]
MLRFLSLLWLAAAAAFGQDPISPHSAVEPKAAKAAASLAESTKNSAPELLTTGEKSDWNRTAPYAEAVEISRKLERASRFVKVLDIGNTPEGRAMIAVVVSKDRAFTPEAAARTNKAVIMIQSGIHAGEIEGKDTVLMLIRDMTVGKRFAGWLDHAIFVIIPVFNVDGHENVSPFHRPSQNGPQATGLRANAQRLNLNRDYVKADTPEMHAWLRIFNTWMPDFLIDNHVTDGSDMQYDVTWDMARNQDIAEPVGSWVRDKFVPELDKRMAADGHMVAPYGALRNMGGKREFFMEVFSPRYSHLYAAVQNRPSLLVETHSLKAAKTRAWANYDIMRHSIDTILLDPDGLRRAVREADRAMADRAGNRTAPPVYLAGKVSEKSRPLVYHALKTEQYKSEVTGANVIHYTGEPDDLDTRLHDQIDTTLEAQMPLGYLVPAAWKQVTDLLALHGVEMERTTKPLEQEFETYRFTGTKFAASAVEGHVMVDFEPHLVKERIAIPAGSYWIPLKQRRSRLILSMLEPQAPDSLARWGLMDSVFEGRGGVGEYLSEPIVRRMMVDSPEMRKQFEEKLAADPKFAADRQARLAWWYQQSKYQPEDSGRYPIVRVWEKNW